MRVVVVGTSGSGKTTFARALARKRGIPHVELDALHWLPQWTERAAPEFRQAVAAATSGPAWVADGNYSAVRDVLWPRATDVVWLNFGRATVVARILRRTLARALTRETLWAGNRESLRKALLTRDSILLWSLRTYGRNRRRYADLRSSGDYPQLHWHELRRPADARTLLRAFRQGD